jgi:hypothetical protein
MDPYNSYPTFLSGEYSKLYFSNIILDIVQFLRYTQITNVPIQMTFIPKNGGSMFLLNAGTQLNTTQRNTSEDQLYSHRRENVMSYKHV